MENIETLSEVPGLEYWDEDTQTLKPIPNFYGDSDFPENANSMVEVDSTSSLQDDS